MRGGSNLLGVLAFALCSVTASTSGHAASIGYANVGHEAPAFKITATGGHVLAHLYSSDASYFDSLGLVGAKSGNDVLNNAGTNGRVVDFGTFAAGTTLDFFLDVRNTGERFYSNAVQNSDGLNHAYASSFGGDATVSTAGTYVGFEDLKGGGDLDYNDMAFVFTNTVSSVPLPASLPMFAAALVALAGLRTTLAKRGARAARAA